MCYGLHIIWQFSITALHLYFKRCSYLMVQHKTNASKTVYLLNGSVLNSAITKQCNYTTTASRDSASSKIKLSQKDTLTEQYNF